jgi:hypothetical protein
VKAARHIAREHGSMPYEVRTVSHTQREGDAGPSMSSHGR